MATWYLQYDADGTKTVLFKNKQLFASAGKCSPATPDRIIIEWIVNEADSADVIVTSEGSFALPFRPPTKRESRC